jgi:hypothetical protein
MREICEVIRNDYIGAARPSGCDYVPVVRIWQMHGGDERFPVSYQSVRKGRLHLLEQSPDVGVCLFR